MTLNSAAAEMFSDSVTARTYFPDSWWWSGKNNIINTPATLHFHSRIVGAFVGAKTESHWWETLYLSSILIDRPAMNLAAEAMEFKLFATSVRYHWTTLTLC